MSNLLANALRYGQIVEVSAIADHRRFIVTVDDDGPGIPPELREDAFRPFVRLDASRNQDETGTGLGLAIARDIARGHGGDITLDVSPAGGLRAVVEIPV
jgi:two-component system osmolarity sensor histidine kinase EnvZ